MISLRKSSINYNLVLTFTEKLHIIDGTKKNESFVRAAASAVALVFCKRTCHNLPLWERMRQVVSIFVEIQGLDAFRIHPQYEDISKEANALTDEIHSLTNTLAIRQQLLERYESSYIEENPELPIADIERVYAEAGVLFQNSVLRSLSEVIEFHKTIVSNRKEYLRNEIESLRKEIIEIALLIPI